MRDITSTLPWHHVPYGCKCASIGQSCAAPCREHASIGSKIHAIRSEHTWSFPFHAWFSSWSDQHFVSLTLNKIRIVSWNCLENSNSNWAPTALRLWKFCIINTWKVCQCLKRCNLDGTANWSCIYHMYLQLIWPLVPEWSFILFHFSRRIRMEIVLFISICMWSPSGIFSSRYTHASYSCAHMSSYTHHSKGREQEIGIRYHS
jgi:hypothetical protein